MEQRGDQVYMFFFWVLPDPAYHSHKYTDLCTYFVYWQPHSEVIGNMFITKPTVIFNTYDTIVDIFLDLSCQYFFL